MNSSNTEPIIIGRNLTIEDIWYLHANPKKVILDTEQINKVQLCRETLDEINSNEEPVYGVSTGFGHLENKWIPPEKQGKLQVNLIRSHAIGTGKEVPKDIVKMAMILLVNSLAKGHSGIRLDTLERLLFYLHHDIIPVSYTIGSLGASGDLAPLAHLALTIIGEGEVYHEGTKVETNIILEKYEIEPIDLAAKEGLALINGTHFITAYALLLLQRAHKLFKLTQVSAALTIEALRGTDTPFREEIANIRHHRGHQVISSVMRQLLKDSKIIESHKDPRIDHKTQDAYALRCIPQVLGGTWDAFAYLERVVESEINSVTDNPLIFPSTGEIFSGGNFHAEPLGFPLETVIMALIEIANISEARIARLVSPFTPELPAFLANKPGIESGYMIAHYTVAGLVNKLRGLAHPNITDNIPVSGNQEDHVSMVMTTAVRSWEVLGLVEEVVTFELMLAQRGLNLVDHPKSSPVLEEIISLINEQIEFTAEDHIIRDTLKQYKNMTSGNILVRIFDSHVDIPNQFN